MKSVAWRYKFLWVRSQRAILGILCSQFDIGSSLYGDSEGKEGVEGVGRRRERGEGGRGEERGKGRWGEFQIWFMSAILRKGIHRKCCSRGGKNAGGAGAGVSGWGGGVEYL